MPEFDIAELARGLKAARAEKADLRRPLVKLVSITEGGRREAR